MKRREKATANILCIFGSSMLSNGWRALFYSTQHGFLTIIASALVKRATYIFEGRLISVAGTDRADLRVKQSGIPHSETHS